MIAIATRENLIILTFDRDYGEIIFKSGLANPPAVVFFRYKGNDVLFAGQRVISLSKSLPTIDHCFIVVEENSFRQRPYKIVIDKVDLSSFL